MAKIVVYLAAMSALFISIPALAVIQTELVEYEDKGVKLEGFVAFDDAVQEPRPGVLVVHEWKGLGDYAKRRATELASLGYVAFAVDMYGKDVRPQTHDEAAKVSGMYRSDRPLMRARILAALDEFKKMPFVDASKIAAVGYCFGGTTVIELARSGADIMGVASFHGGLDSPTPEDGKNIKAKVRVFNGADDQFISPENLAAFEKEMTDAAVDYKRIDYPGAVHSFTVPEAGNDPSTGMAYNAEADQKSWEALKAFLTEIFR